MLSLMPTQAMKPYATKVVVQACSVTEKPIILFALSAVQVDAWQQIQESNALESMLCSNAL
jgi:hypothetical protein